MVSKPPREAATVQTLDRGLRVLHLLAGSPEGVTVSELASSLEVHRAIVYRLLATLAAHRLVIKGDDGRYRLWTGLVELARGVIPRWRQVAWPELETLADELGCTATLSVASEDSCVTLLVAEPRTASLHVAYQPGLRHPLTVGASGKAILAGRPSQPGEPSEIASARRRGIARSEGEIQDGAFAIAAPILVEDWADASVAVVSFRRLDAAGERRVAEAASRIASAAPAAIRPAS